ncbi:MAG: site-specific integrase [Tenuifilaceae bacterium]
MKRFYPFVKANYNTKTGEIPIYVRYNYDRLKRTFIPLNQFVANEHWDFKKKWVKKSCPDFDKIDKELVSLMTRVGNIITYATDNNIEPTVEHVLIELAKNKEYDSITTRTDLFLQLEKYIEEKKTKVVKDVIKDYNSLKKHLTGFKEHSSQPITFKNLNIVFYNEFVDYLSYTAKQKNETIGLKNNTVGKQIKNLKAFVRDRIEKKIIPFIDMKPFKTIKEEVDHIYLTENELKVIYDLNLSEKSELEQIRDLFIVGCFTGLRYSDLSTLSSANIDLISGMIQTTQKKVHKSVTIPIIDYVPDLLRKYNLELPKMHLNDFNKGLKDIGELAGLKQKHEIVHKKGTKQIKEVFMKYELMSSHTCRRSFCTNMYLAGFPAEELMKISGHKSTIAFLTYIKVDNFQAANRLKALRKKLVA